MKALLERAIKDHPSEYELWETYVEFEVRSLALSLSLHPLSSQSLNSFHGSDFEQWKIPEKDSTLMQVGEKSIRFNPSNAQLWATYFRIAVRSFLSKLTLHVAEFELEE